ncbi:MAG TPA: hypothetical protein VMI10_04525 [Terriglobales bacterium]|nr:hypothetical protein [Terriglobales bacterium]
MSLHSQTTIMALWYSQPVLQVAVAIVVWRRGLYKQFPVFLAFLLTQVGGFVISYPVYKIYGQSTLAYFGLYWSEEALSAVLSFKIIHEVFLDVFRPYHSLKDLGTPVFKWAGLVMLLVAMVVAASNSSEGNPIVNAVLTLQRSVRLVQVGLILFLILFSQFLGVSRRQVSFGIALGFGISAGGELMLLAMHSGRLIHMGNLNLINMMCCNASILVFLLYSFSKVVAREAGGNYLQTQRWERGLADLQPAASNDSLIPMFEGMVERAFSRSSNLEDIDRHLTFNKPPAPSRAKSAAAGSKSKQ